MQLHTAMSKYSVYRYVEYSVLTMQLPTALHMLNETPFPYTILPIPHERKQLHKSE